MKAITIVILVLLNSHAIAQSVKHDKKDNQGQVHLIIHQPDQDPKNSKHQLTLNFSALPSTARIVYSATDTIFKEKVDYRAFDLKIPAAKAGMRIHYSIGGKTGTAYRGMIRDYLIQAGDTIEMIIKKDSLHFLGKTARLLNLQSQIFVLQRPQLPDLTYENPNYFKLMDGAFEEMLNRELKFIELHKCELTNEYYTYLRNQAIGYRHFMRIRLIAGYAIIDSKLGLRAAKYYLENPVKVPLPRDENLDQSPNFIDFLYQKERMDYETMHPTANFEKRGGQIILDNITRKYTGRVRDRLLIVAFVDLSKSYLDVSTYFSKNPALIPKNSPYYNIYTKINHAFDPSIPAYDFALTDTAGRIVKLSDFKGKVVLLDFWFTGCLPCKYLKAAMVPVFEEIKKAKDLVFLTVSVDKDRQIWINSIKAGTYTHSGSINLIAPGGRDPILKNYNISAYPRLMLIDKAGKIASMKLPTPHTREGKTELIETIEKALKD